MHATAIPEAGDVDSGGADSARRRWRRRRARGAGRFADDDGRRRFHAGVPAEGRPDGPLPGRPGRAPVSHGRRRSAVAHREPLRVRCRLLLRRPASARLQHGLDQSPLRRLHGRARATGRRTTALPPSRPPGICRPRTRRTSQRVDDMLRLAAKYDLNVMLDPAETGGWLSASTRTGRRRTARTASTSETGTRSFDNIVWMSGNDFQSWRTASDDAAASAVALGIKDVDTRHIHTVELDYNTSSSSDDPTWVPIIGLDAAYTYYPTYAQVLKSYNRANPAARLPRRGRVRVRVERAGASGDDRHPPAPGVLDEPERRDGADLRQPLHLDVRSGWKGMLDSPGAVQMPHVRDLLAPRRVVRARPRPDALRRDGRIRNDDHDGPRRRQRLRDRGADAGRLARHGIHADVAHDHGRHDPAPRTRRARSSTTRAAERTAAVAGSPLPNTGSHMFTPPGPNGDGDGDWVLVLEAP